MIQRPARQPADESGLLRERNEVRGSQQAARRMLPPQQNLGARDAAGPELDFRLEEQAQLVVLDGMAQFAQQRELVAGRGFERLFVDRERTLVAARRVPSARSAQRINSSADVAAVGGERQTPASRVMSMGCASTNTGSDSAMTSEVPHACRPPASRNAREGRELVGREPRHRRIHRAARPRAVPPFS